MLGFVEMNTRINARQRQAAAGQLGQYLAKPQSGGLLQFAAARPSF
jgi:hypothetical protein